MPFSLVLRAVLSLMLLAGTLVAQQSTGQAAPPPPAQNEAEPQESSEPPPQERTDDAAEEAEETDLPEADRSPSSSDSSIAIILDTSQVARPDFDELTGGVQNLLQWFTTEDELCLYSAGESPQLVQEFTADKSRLSAQLKELRPAGDRALDEAVRAAADYIRSDAANQNAAIVVFASAQRTAGDLDELAALGRGLRVPVHVVAAPGSDWRAQEQLQQLATGTKGTAYFPSSPQQLYEVSEELSRRLGGPIDDAEALAELAPSPADPARYRGLLSSYDRIVVREIPIAEGKETAEILGGEEVLLHRILVSRLRRADLFDEVVDGGGTAAASTKPEPGKALELLATITEYRQGNRVQRQTLGAFGRGAARMGVRVVLLDAATRRPLLAFTESAAHGSGLFGGSPEHVQSRAILELANEIVEQLRAAR